MSQYSLRRSGVVALTALAPALAHAAPDFDAIFMQSLLVFIVSASAVGLVSGLASGWLDWHNRKSLVLTVAAVAILLFMFPLLRESWFISVFLLPSLALPALFWLDFASVENVVAWLGSVLSPGLPFAVYLLGRTSGVKLRKRFLEPKQDA